MIILVLGNSTETLGFLFKTTRAAKTFAEEMEETGWPFFRLWRRDGYFDGNCHYIEVPRSVSTTYMFR